MSYIWRNLTKLRVITYMQERLMLSYSEVQQILNLSPYQLRKLVASGALLATSGKHSHRSIPVDQVNAYLKQAGSTLTVQIDDGVRLVEDE